MARDPLTVHQSDPSECLAQFKAARLDGLDVAGDPAKVGTLIHRVAERLVEEKRATPLVDVYAVARDVVRSEARTIGLSPAGVVDALEILERVLGSGSKINLWPSMGFRGDAEYRWSLVLVGEDFEFREGHVEGAYAAGTIDLVEYPASGAVGMVRITDWKTARQMYGDEDAWESWQARLYAFAMLRRFPSAKTVEFQYGMLRHGYYSSPVDFVRGDPWEWGVAARLRATREAREAAVGSGEWPETAGPWCHYCPVRWKCGSFLRVNQMGADVPADWSPAEIATALSVAKTQVRDLEKRAREIAERTNAPILLPGPSRKALGFRVVDGVETVLPYEETMSALRAYGMTAAQQAEHFRFVARNHYASRVRKVAREVLGVPREEIENLVVPVPKTEFTTFTYDAPQDASSDRPVTLDELESFLLHDF